MLQWVLRSHLVGTVHKYQYSGLKTNKIKGLLSPWEEERGGGGFLLVGKKKRKAVTTRVYRA